MSKNVNIWFNVLIKVPHVDFFSRGVCKFDIKLKVNIWIFLFSCELDFPTFHATLGETLSTISKKKLSMFSSSLLNYSNI